MRKLFFVAASALSAADYCYSDANIAIQVALQVLSLFGAATAVARGIKLRLVLLRLTLGFILSHERASRTLRDEQSMTVCFR